MIYHYIKSFLANVKKNLFFYTINMVGFLAGFLLLTIIVTFVYQEINFDRFHKNGASIYRIHSGGYGVTPLCFKEKLKNQIPEITGIVRFSSSNMTMVYNSKEVNIGRVYHTDPEIFQIFSFNLVSGNTHQVLDAPFSIVINKSTAHKLYGNRSPLGELIRDKDGNTYTITGVIEDIPYSSHIQSNAFISIETLRHTGDENTFNCGSWRNLTYVRLAEKSNSTEVETKINSILKDSRMGSGDGKFQLKLQLLKRIYFDSENNKFDGTSHGNPQTIMLYGAISILLLLIVIINYINLYTAVLRNRIKVVAIHKIIGAMRKQIVKQSMLESLGIALISFIFTLFIIELFLPQLSSLLNLSIAMSLNRPVLYLYYFMGIFFIGAIIGIVPGIFLSKINEVKALKNDFGLSSKGIQRKVLLIFQLIVVAILLNFTFIINNQIRFALSKDLGFQYTDVVYFHLNKILQEKSALLRNRLLENPGIKGVSFSAGIIGEEFSKHPVKIGDFDKICNIYLIDPYYLDLYKIRIKYGRNFSPALEADSINRWIINEAACKAFDIKNPIGKSTSRSEIIGVTCDFNFTSLHNKIAPLIMQCGKGDVVQIKISAGNQKEILNFIKNTCKSMSPDFECNYSFLENRIKQLYKSEIELENSFEIYSLITFIVALLGLLGLTLFQIRKKTKEISIRKLFGARPNDTFKLFSEEQILIALIANIIAIPISFFIINKWLNNFQFRVDFGVLIFLKTFFIIVAFMLLAVSFVLIKTYKTDLIATLKYE